MPIIAFDIMPAEYDEDGMYVPVVFRTQGDWRGTPEGEEAMDMVIGRLSNLPPELSECSLINIADDSNDAKLCVPCTPDNACHIQETLQARLPILTRIPIPEI